jgi:hypothetical protein
MKEEESQVSYNLVSKYQIQQKALHVIQRLEDHAGYSEFSPTSHYTVLGCSCCEVTGMWSEVTVIAWYVPVRNDLKKTNSMV